MEVFSAVQITLLLSRDVAVTNLMPSLTFEGRGDPSRCSNSQFCVNSAFMSGDVAVSYLMPSLISEGRPDPDPLSYV